MREVRETNYKLYLMGKRINNLNFISRINEWLMDVTVVRVSMHCSKVFKYKCFSNTILIMVITCDKMPLIERNNYKCSTEIYIFIL